MEELRGFLASHGYDIPNLILDGRVHRFSRNGSKDSGWLIGWVHSFIKKPGSYCLAQFGDWRTGEIHSYLPATLGGAEKELAKTVIKEAQRKVQIERAVLNKEAAVKAKIRFENAATEGVSPYIIRKCMKSLYGARIERENIVVPMQNIEGEIVGTQRIMPNGQKFFEKGQKTEGAFFLIGSFEGTVCLCEGYATAASVHEASGYSTVATFSANNLVKVAKAIRKAHPDLDMIICGDDDYKNDRNVGREKAEEAGHVSMSPVTFPVFKGERGTDFNDLLAIEGIEAVQAIILKKEEPAAGFRSLGYDDHGHYFYRIDAKDIFRLSALDKKDCFHLAPESFWMANYKTEDKTNYTRAANDLINASIGKGRFDIHSVRGMGVWLDRGEVVINTGSNLLIKGKETPLSWSGGEHIYVHSHHKMARSKNVADLEMCSHLLRACERLKFADRCGHFFLAGWIAISRIAGALPVRPHLWLTGGSATGKSTVLNQLIEPALGGSGTFLSCVGGTTEAGIRQTLRSSSMPAVFDEFESISKTTKDRHESILELLRNTWSATNGQVIKGSAGGVSQGFNLAFPALLSSIGVNLNTDADRSRFTVLELLPHGDNPEQYRTLMECLRLITPDLGNAIFNRMIGKVGTLLANYNLLRDSIAVRSRQRLGQQIGMLMAGWSCLAMDEPLTREQADEIADELEVKRINEDRDAEENDCLRHLMTQIIKLDEGMANETATIEQVIFDKSLGDEGFAKELRKYGILLKGDSIFVATNHAYLTSVFKNSQWSNYSAHLRRLPGANASKGTKHFGSAGNVRCVEIPLSTIRN